MDLNDLPQFTVIEVRRTLPGENTEVVGWFSHLRGVRNSDGYLFRPGGPSLVGGFIEMPRKMGAPLVFITPDADLAPELAPGAVYAWLDAYWHPYHLDMILAGPSTWTRQDFVAGTAHYFRLAGVIGWQPTGEPLLEGAEDLGERVGGWDHEHCELCRATIGFRGAPEGYVNAENYWLCSECYERYAVRSDVSFACEE